MSNLPAITTYRHALRGALADFVDKTPFKKILDAADLVEVAACVAYHVEEGIRLYPEVIVCIDIQDLSRQAPNSQFIEIGSDTEPTTGIRKALKKLSPLTSRDWVIVLERNKTGIRFGVYNPSPSPVSVDFGASLETNGDENFPVIRISRICEDVVRFFSPGAGETLLSFSHKEITEKDLAPNASRLAEAIILGAPKTASTSSATTYLKRTLEYSLQQCHGALICVVHDDGPLPPLLANGIRLTPPIDFIRLTSQFLQSDENNEIKGRPFVYFDLIAGIIAFDGVTVFSRNGKLVAYNCILDLSAHSTPQKNLGGSRRAAYAMLKSELGKSLVCAYYQSQDGPSEISTNA